MGTLAPRDRRRRSGTGPAELGRIAHDLARALLRACDVVHVDPQGDPDLAHAQRAPGRGHDYTRGFKFSTYATWWIKQTMRRGIIDRGTTIRVPVHAADARTRVKRARDDLVQLHGRRPTEHELAEQLGLTRERVRQIEKSALTKLRASSLRDRDAID